MKIKKTILILIDYYLPGYKGGGPAKSVKNLTEHLANDFIFKIITSDHDLGNKNKYSGIQINKWNKIGNAEVFYASSRILNFPFLMRLINNTQYDILYLNSFFQPTFSIQLIVARYFNLLKNKNILIAPRGELEDGCLRIRSIKKSLFIALSKIFCLYNGLSWHATNEYEATSITKIFPRSKNKISIASNLTPKINEPILTKEEHDKVSDNLNICFISRITREKNLDYALSIIKKLSIPVSFNIYGTNHEDVNYWKICQKLIDEINKAGTHIITFHGSLTPDQVIEKFKSHDLFFFPTRGENFGHVIFESFTAGTPVLTSDQTPWKDLDKLGIGWTIPLSRPEFFIEKIEYFCKLQRKEYVQIRKRVLSFAHQFSCNTNTIDSSRKLFTNNFDVNG
jgi:glycosyltransferase involved in cell wall biosynthesis